MQSYLLNYSSLVCSLLQSEMGEHLVRSLLQSEMGEHLVCSLLQSEMGEHLSILLKVVAVQYTSEYERSVFFFHHKLH